MPNTKKKQSHWYILGTGAIGTLWATKLLEKNINCTLLLPEEKQMDFPQEISITHVDGSQKAYEVATEVITNSSVINQLIVCTKSYQTLAAIKSIAHRLTENTSVLLLQNGMGQHELVSSYFPCCNIIAGTTTEGALLEDKGKVQNTGLGQSYFGQWNRHKTLDSKVINDLLNINMIQHKNIHQALWDKLVVNCIINPLTVLYQCKNGALLENETLLDRVRQLSSEIDYIAQSVQRSALHKSGPNTKKTSKENNSSTLERALTVAKATKENFSSMHQDIKHQRKTEIDFINGYLLKKASEYNLQAPLNKQIVTQIKELERNFCDI